MTVNIRQLEVFAAVMRNGTLTAAAMELGLSQPAVTKILRHTESQLGIQLFHRINKRLYPTDYATAIFPPVDLIFQNLETVQMRLTDFKDAQTGIVRVATIPTLGSAFLPEAILNFTKRYKKAKLQLKFLEWRLLAPRVASRQVDLAICYAPLGENTTTFIDLPAAEVVCVLPRADKLSENVQITPYDLRDHRIISISRISSIGEKIHAAFESFGVRRDTIVETSYSHIAYDLVEKGVGIAVVDPFTLYHHRPPGIVVRPFRPSIRIVPRVLHASGIPLSRMNKEFIHSLKITAERTANI